VPCDTYDDVGLYDPAAGRGAGDGADIVACNSGVLEIIFCARLMALVEGLT